MSYRFTNTDKWNDAWFSNLTQIQMLLFIYLCDNCDMAGFIEMNLKRWASDLSSSIETIQGALKGLERGFIISDDGDCMFMKNFLKHQKNLPLNEKNKAHIGILRRFEYYSEKFDIKDVNDFIERGIKGGSKGLQSPTGNGNGIGKGKGKEKEIEVGWRDDLEIYLSECENAYTELVNDKPFIKEQLRLNPGVDVKLSIEKGYINFWHTEAGWKHKKKGKASELNWKSTFTKAIDLNKVYFPKDYKPIESTKPLNFVS